MNLPSIARPQAETIAQKVYRYLSERYPAHLLTWVLNNTPWRGPVAVPLQSVEKRDRPDGIDWDEVSAFVAKLQHPELTKPVVLVEAPAGKYMIVDGWHRVMAHRLAGYTTVVAFVGRVQTTTGPWTSDMPRAAGTRANGVVPGGHPTHENTAQLLHVLVDAIKHLTGLSRHEALVLAHKTCRRWASGRGQVTHDTRSKAAHVLAALNDAIVRPTLLPSVAKGGK